MRGTGDGAAQPEPEAAPSARWALVATVGVIVAANAPYLVGLFDPNPMLYASGLRTVSPGWFTGTTSLDPNAGFTAQANGHRAALDWLHLRLPWWNPWEATGAPLAAGLASGAFFVPFVLLTVFPNGQVIEFTLLDLLAGTATFAVLRRLGIAPWICCVGGVLYGLNGTDAWFRFGATNPVAFLPVMVLGVEHLRAAAEEERRGGWVLLAVGVAFSVLASFPETALLDGAVVGIWLVARSASLTARQAAVVIRRAGVGLATGLLLAAPLIVAFADFSAVASVGGHASDAFGHASVASEGAVSTIAPYALGPIGGFQSPSADYPAVWGNLGGYLTAAVAVVAIVGLCGRRLRGLRLPLGVLSALFLARNFGFGPAVHLLLLVPGLGHLATYRYDNPAVEMAVVVLVALGLDDVRRGSARRWLSAGAGIVVLGVGIGVWRLARSLDRGLTGASVGLWWDVSFAWAAGSGLVVVVALALGRRRAVLVALGVLLSLEAVAMFAVPDLSAPKVGPADDAAVSFLRAHVGTGRFFSLGPFAPNYGAYYGVASLDVNDNPLPESVVRYELSQLAPNAVDVIFNGVATADPDKPTVLAQLPDHLAGYRQAAVDYVVLQHGVALPSLPPGTLTLAYHDGFVDIYRLAGAAPYFTSDRCQLSFSSTVSVLATCDGPGRVLRRETMVPGWTATWAGHTVTPRSVGGFQEVVVPSGHHLIRFSYVPPHETVAWVAFAVGLAVLVAGPRWPVRRHRAGHRVGSVHMVASGATMDRGSSTPSTGSGVPE